MSQQSFDLPEHVHDAIIELAGRILPTSGTTSLLKGRRDARTRLEDALCAFMVNPTSGWARDDDTSLDVVLDYLGKELIGLEAQLDIRTEENNRMWAGHNDERELRRLANGLSVQLGREFPDWEYRNVVASSREAIVVFDVCLVTLFHDPESGDLKVRADGQPVVKEQPISHNLIDNGHGDQVVIDGSGLATLALIAQYVGMLSKQRRALDPHIQEQYITARQIKLDLGIRRVEEFMEGIIPIMISAERNPQ
jgi:hypothetical protein